MRKKRLIGFSLFEILIVLVILIIVIGIGHPLWSGAVVSAQKATALSHLKQLSQCVFLYTNDNEGKLLSGYVKNARGEIEDMGQVPIPAMFPPTSPGFDQAHMTHWSNQLFVYTKHPELYTAPGFIEVGEENKPHVAFTYNGLLHDYPLAQITEPSHVPVFWCGLGNIALAGQAFTTPYLKLQTGKGAIKHGDAQVDSTLIAPSQMQNIVKHSYGSFWVYDKSSPMVYLDGSARAIKIDKLGNKSPFSLDIKGVPNRSQQSVKHVDYFIPR